MGQFSQTPSTPMPQPPSTPVFSPVSYLTSVRNRSKRRRVHASWCVQMWFVNLLVNNNDWWDPCASSGRMWAEGFSRSCLDLPPCCYSSYLEYETLNFPKFPNMSSLDAHMLFLGKMKLIPMLAQRWCRRCSHKTTHNMCNRFWCCKNSV